MMETLKQLNIPGRNNTKPSKSDINEIKTQPIINYRRETIVKIISVSTGTSYVFIITSKFGHVGIYDDKLRLQRKYEIDIDTDPDSDLDVAASDPGWITDAVWMDNSKHMVYTSSLRYFITQHNEYSIMSHLPLICLQNYPFL